jgi:cation diffusion facilitator family transporter
MNHRTIHAWRHDHNYLSDLHGRGEARTRRVIILTASMMVVEIAAGTVFNSMALLADGWHMASHASALGITAFAYAYARHHATDARYSFGTWKVGVLGGFTSAVVLAVIALLIAWESMGRFWQPLEISFNEAIAVAVVGLVVNLVSAYILEGRDASHSHGADTTGTGDHAHHHHDHNLRAAYLHVLADALTSLFAIVALTAGKFFGWVWLDPMMGIVGSLIIGRWSYGLLRDTSRVLLDGDVDSAMVSRIRSRIEEDADNGLADLHLWRIGPNDLAAIVSLVTHDPRPPDHYKALIEDEFPLSHVTVEVNRCPDESCESERTLQGGGRGSR